MHAITCDPTTILKQQIVYSYSIQKFSQLRKISVNEINKSLVRCLQREDL